MTHKKILTLLAFYTKATIFLFQDVIWHEDGAKQSENYFETAPRWIYHYSPPGV